MHGSGMHNRRKDKRNSRYERTRRTFAGLAAVMALALMLGSVPVSVLYAEQSAQGLRTDAPAHGAEGESVPEEKNASENEEIREDGDGSEKSVTSPNAEKQPEEPGESAEEAETVCEAETVSANVLTAGYRLRAAAADKSGGLEFRWQTDLPKVETEYTAGGGSILWTPELAGNEVTGGTLILRDAVIDADGMGIWVCVPTTIVLEGNNQILAGKTNINASGIYLDGAGSSVITGTGSLEIRSQGSGIKSARGITIDGAEISVSYVSGNNGIWTSYADITIRNNSRVTVKGPGSTGAVCVQNIYDIVIENSKVTVINDSGAAMHTSGNIRLTSSDVRAVGNTDSGYASGTLSVGYGKRIVMDGGTLYAENTGNDIEFPYVRDNAEMKNGAILYTKQTYSLFLQGSGVCYTGCGYDQNTDQIISIGNGDVVGSVTWNERMCIPEGKSLRVGRYYDGALTVPEGAVVDIPEKSFLDIYSADGKKGTLINNGTINIPDGAALYNMYDQDKQTGGTVENNGTIQVADAGILQNRSDLTNNGVIHSTGNFSNIRQTGYQGSIHNTGVIDGFVIETLDDAYVNQANGNTVIKKGQMLTLGAGADSTGKKSRTLRVAEGATLTVEEGAVVDAKTNVTKDTLSQYLDIADTLVLKGILLLPADTPEDVVSELGRYIEGEGSVRLGDGAGQSAYYIAQVTGGAAGNTGAGLYREGTAVAVDAGGRDGYRFTGWTAVPDSVVFADALAAQTTFVMPKGSVTLTANWERITCEVTVNGSKAAVTGAGTYAPGAVVSVDAGFWEGYLFQGWRSSDGVTFADPLQAATTFVMPAHPVTVTASWNKKPEEMTPSEEETVPQEETAPSEEETVPQEETTRPTEETTASPGETGSSSGNKPSSSGTSGKEENGRQEAKPEETLPAAKSERVRNQSTQASVTGADTGDASHMGWYLLSGILSLSAFIYLRKKVPKI